MLNNNPGLSLFTPISENLPSNVLFTCNVPKQEAITTSRKEKQVEYRDIFTPVVGNINHKNGGMETLRLLQYVFRAVGPQSVCQLMEMSLSSSAK